MQRCRNNDNKTVFIRRTAWNKPLAVSVTAIHCLSCRKLMLVLLTEFDLTIKTHTQRAPSGVFGALMV